MFYYVYIIPYMTCYVKVFLLYGMLSLAVTVFSETDYLMLNTSTKSWKAILYFYIDELDICVWNTRPFV